MPGQALQPGDMAQISIALSDAAEQEAIFNKLATGGKIPNMLVLSVARFPQSTALRPE